MKRKVNSFIACVVMLTVLCVVAGCERTSDDKDQRMVVATSIYPVSDWVTQIGGDKIEVICLLPPGASPHTFEPTPDLVRQLLHAEMFVKIGRGIDDWGDKIVTAASREQVSIVLLSERMPELPPLLSPDDSRSNHAHSVDPHLWLDPVLAQQMVLHIADELSRSRPEHDAFFHNNAEKYMEELKELHLWIEKELADLAQREFIAFHSSVTYYAYRYDLKPVALIEPSPGKEPTIKRVTELIDLLESMDKKVVFAEPQLSDKAAIAIAREVDARVVYLDPLGNPDVPERSNYIALMRHNTLQIKKALS